MPNIALDLDRVLFDTNNYLQFLKSRFATVNLDFETIVKKSADCGRKDLTTMVNIVAEDIGKDKSEDLFFKNTSDFWKGGVAEIFSTLRSRFDKIFVITVGDGYQSKKISGLNIDGLFVVDSDSKKVTIAKALHEKYNDLIFVDDKKTVVTKMNANGINSFQALWFLDERYRKNCHDKHLNKAGEILDL